MMRLGWTTNKDSVTYRAIKTVRVGGKNKTVVVRTFGSARYICETYGVTDARAWAEEQVRLMREEEGIGERHHIELCAGTDLPFEERRLFHGGYLFLQAVYCQLGLPGICGAISKRRGLAYDLNDILSRLVYTQILFPDSGKRCLEESGRFIEPPSFAPHEINRAISVLAEESGDIQSQLFQAASSLLSRNTGTVYCHRVNFCFACGQEEDKRYGVSGETRPLPTVEMELFSDADGIPIAFGLVPGDGSGQNAMTALAKKMRESFDRSKFVLCADAGLSSATDRTFDGCDGEAGNRACITTQPVGKLEDRQGDARRFARTCHMAQEDGAAGGKTGAPDQAAVEEEERYDGFCAICTDLEDSPEAILTVSRRQREIEECFRAMKTDFRAGPGSVPRQDRILAHGTTCFIALILCRCLEMRLGEQYTTDRILDTLREMNFVKQESEGYQPVYERTALTDALHDAFGFCTSRQIVPARKMKNICADTKKQEVNCASPQ